MNNSDKPAFPAKYTDHSDPAFPELRQAVGISKLELFSAMAMQGMLAADVEFRQGSPKIASWSVECAKALLAELEGRAAE